VLGALAVAVHAEVPTTRLRQMIYAYPPSTAPSNTPSTISTRKSLPTAFFRAQRSKAASDISVVSPNGLLQLFTKNVLETAAVSGWR